eukprot:510112-Ditylum_brightwellii.AAC.1
MHNLPKHSTQMHSCPNSSNSHQTVGLDSIREVEVDKIKLEAETVYKAEEKPPEDNTSSITVGLVVQMGIILMQISKIQHRDTFPMPLLLICKVNSVAIPDTGCNHRTGNL